MTLLAAPVAHRGLHGPGAPENSLAAIDAAARAGFGVEIDVQLSADGEAMVFHDATLDRMTDATGPLRARDAAALRALRLRGGGGTIPTLAEALALMAGRSALLVEIKGQGGALGPEGVGPLEARVAALLAGHAGPVAVMSFNPDSVAAMARLAPALPRGLVGCPAAACGGGAPEARARMADLAAFEAVGASFFSYDWRALPTPRTRALRAAGAGALCWTTRSTAEHAAALRHAQQVTFEGYAPPVG